MTLSNKTTVNTTQSENTYTKGLKDKQFIMQKNSDQSYDFLFEDKPLDLEEDSLYEEKE